MKYGKYNLHKSSTNISVGTSYSWYYRKNDNPTTKRKKKKLVRTASDSTLFSDYANQISIFEKDRRNKKCIMRNSSKNHRNKCDTEQVTSIKPVRIEPFTGNFYYGKPLPGYDFCEKTEEKITYLPDSDDVSPSEETITTLESLTTAPTVVDVPELVRNPLYGCQEAESHLLAPEYFTDTNSKDSQLNTSSCTEIKDTMCSNKDNDLYESILKEFKRNMQEWNNTIMDHYSSMSHSKKASSMCRSNTSSYVRSLHSTLSCRKHSKNCINANNKSYDYAYIRRNFGEKGRETYNNPNIPFRKSKTLDRNQTFNTTVDSSLTTTLRNLKKKATFWKDSTEKLETSECDCLEAIYDDYDRRLQECFDSLSICSSLISSV